MTTKRGFQEWLAGVDELVLDQGPTNPQFEGYLEDMGEDAWLDGKTPQEFVSEFDQYVQGFEDTRNERGRIWNQTHCEACGGVGMIGDDPCEACQGQGYIGEAHKFTPDSKEDRKSASRSKTKPGKGKWSRADKKVVDRDEEDDMSLKEFFMHEVGFGQGPAFDAAYDRWRTEPPEDQNEIGWDDWYYNAHQMLVQSGKLPKGEDISNELYDEMQQAFEQGESEEEFAKYWQHPSTGKLEAFDPDRQKPSEYKRDRADDTRKTKFDKDDEQRGLADWEKAPKKEAAGDYDDEDQDDEWKENQDIELWEDEFWAYAQEKYGASAQKLNAMQAQIQDQFDNDVPAEDAVDELMNPQMSGLADLGESSRDPAFKPVEDTEDEAIECPKCKGDAHGCPLCKGDGFIFQGQEGIPMHKMSHLDKLMGGLGEARSDQTDRKRWAGEKEWEEFKADRRDTRAAKDPSLDFGEDPDEDMFFGSPEEGEPTGDFEDPTSSKNPELSIDTIQDDPIDDIGFGDVEDEEVPGRWGETGWPTASPDDEVRFPEYEGDPSYRAATAGQHKYDKKTGRYTYTEPQPDEKGFYPRAPEKKKKSSVKEAFGFKGASQWGNLPRSTTPDMRPGPMAPAKPEEGDWTIGGEFVGSDRYGQQALDYAKSRFGRKGVPAKFWQAVKYYAYSDSAKSQFENDPEGMVEAIAKMFKLKPISGDWE